MQLITIAKTGFDPTTLQPVSQALRSGRVAILPTDTVYGLATLPKYQARLFKLKKRPAKKAIPWLAAETSALDKFCVGVPDYAHELAERYWPGALTLICKTGPDARALWSGAADSLALRVPDEEVIREVIRQVGTPLAVTSANLSGLSPQTSYRLVDPRIKQLAEVAVDDGQSFGHEPSTIVDCTGEAPRILRQGPVEL
ncbi:MAG: threonylcarbamoyl-AMP synthase [Coriobacteriales bacterium]|jgi:tRNA threonylcarbamoyl adenosine modification protein (Sua5/YciO/YrdC/YwlC family)|nr:threonylcarbamoyl-AMP synthase [Coriobacteriales bacterium]